MASKQERSCGERLFLNRPKVQTLVAQVRGCPETGTGTLHLVQARGSTHNIREPVPVSGQPLTPANSSHAGGKKPLARASAKS